LYSWCDIHMDFTDIIKCRCTCRCRYSEFNVLSVCYCVQCIVLTAIITWGNDRKTRSWKEGSREGMRLPWIENLKSVWEIWTRLKNWNWFENFNPEIKFKPQHVHPFALFHLILTPLRWPDTIYLREGQLFWNQIFSCSTAFDCRDIFDAEKGMLEVYQNHTFIEIDTNIRKFSAIFLTMSNFLVTSAPCGII